MSSAISRCPRKSCSVRLMGSPFPMLGVARRDSLLAERRRDVGVGLAILRLALAAGDQDLCRAAFGGIGVEALAFLVALALAQEVGRHAAVRRAVGGGRADRPAR